MKRLIWFALIVVVLLGMLMPAAAPVRAQSNPTVEAYVDLVMEHLTTWLSRDRAITRRSNFWQWSQNVYNDTALGCPDPARVYAQQTQRGYRITITVDDVIYDYRVAENGSYFILCGPNGTPLFDSTNPTPPPSTSPTAGLSLPLLAWFAWGYSEISDSMYLFGPTGLITSLTRPNSGFSLTETPQMAISPDGRYMIQREVTAAGEQLSFYSFATGEIYALYGTSSGEMIRMGVTAGNTTYGANTHMFNAGSTRVAVGIEGPELGQWRLVVFDLALGTVVGQLTYTDLVPALASASLAGAPLLQEAVTTIGAGTGLFFPNVIYYDAAGNVHFHLVYAATGGAGQYPAVQWNPSTGVANVSPYIHSQIDVLTTNGTMIYSTVNPFVPVLAAEGPYPSFNQIETGVVSGTTSTPTARYGNASQYLFSPQFASTDGSLSVFVPATPEDFTRFALYGTTYEELSSDTISVLGIAGGAVALELLPGAVPNVVYAQPGGIRTEVYDPPAALTDFDLVWATPPGAALGLTTLATAPRLSPTLGGPTAPTATIPTGPVNCTGTLPSVVSIGSRARVTFTDGTPLRLRSAAGGTFIRDLAEGTPFSVIGGPTCQGAYTWWNIRLDDGTTGWSAEGDSDTYFMEPIS